MGLTWIMKIEGLLKDKLQGCGEKYRPFKIFFLNCADCLDLTYHITKNPRLTCKWTQDVTETFMIENNPFQLHVID